MVLPILFTSKKGNVYIYDFLENRILFLENKNKYNTKNLFLGEKCIWQSSKLGNNIHQEDSNYSQFDSIISKYKQISQLRKNQANNIKIKPIDFHQKIVNCSNLILNITDHCNLNCAYCYYKITPYERSPISKKDMPFMIAKKAIKYYFNLSCSEHRISRYGRKTIGFYGGEPLLRFNFIKKCIHYAESLNFKDDLHFNITTNGILLNKEMLHFFIKNNFNLLISLDGPREEHDKCRIDHISEGTFDKVWRNISLIHDLNEEYFINNVSFNAVCTELHNLNNINKFFNKRFFKHNIIIVGRASGSLDDFNLEQSYSINDVKINFKQQYDQLHHSFIESIEKKKSAPKYIISLFSRYYMPLIKRKYVSYEDRLNAIEKPQLLTCFPGSVRIYVTTDGKLHMCERVNKHSPIGDCNKGIEYEKVTNLMNNYYMQIGKDCVFCEAMHFCQACAATFCSGDKFMRNNYCEKIKKNLCKFLVEYASIMENDPAAFNRYEQYS